MEQIPPEICLACWQHATTWYNGARLCSRCANLTDALAGSETGLQTLMRLGPTLAADYATNT